MGTNASAVRWLAPSQGRYRANWDMAIDKAHGKVGIGVMIRDEKGRAVAIMSKTRIGTLEPTAGEALAAYHAVCLCRELGLQNIYLEGDAKQIVEAINSSMGTWSRFGHLVDDTRHILASFSCWKCDFIHREANEVVYRLAKAATININDRMWRNQIDIVLMKQLALSHDC